MNLPELLIGIVYNSFFFNLPREPPFSFFHMFHEFLENEL